MRSERLCIGAMGARFASAPTKDEAGRPVSPYWESDGPAEKLAAYMIGRGRSATVVHVRPSVLRSCGLR